MSCHVTVCNIILISSSKLENKKIKRNETRNENKNKNKNI